MMLWLMLFGFRKRMLTERISTNQGKFQIIPKEQNSEPENIQNISEYLTYPDLRWKTDQLFHISSPGELRSQEALHEGHFCDTDILAERK